MSFAFVQVVDDSEDVQLSAGSAGSGGLLQPLLAPERSWKRTHCWQQLKHTLGLEKKQVRMQRGGG